MTKIVQFPAVPEGAKHAQLLIDNLRAAEKPVTIPGINWRGATRQDIEHTAFEIERQLAQSIAAIRALVTNLNENLPAGMTIKADSFLEDTFNGGHDLVSEVRGTANRLDDERGWDRG